MPACYTAAAQRGVQRVVLQARGHELRGNLGVILKLELERIFLQLTLVVGIRPSHLGAKPPLKCPRVLQVILRVAEVSRMWG